MSAVKTIEVISPDEYLAGESRADKRYEYVAGRVYAMAGASNSHNAVAFAFCGMVFNRLRGKPCQGFNSDTKVRIRTARGTRFYYPDGMIVCRPNPGSDHFQDSPVVLAEVLSPSTRRTDEGPKLDDYFTIPTLSAYLLVETTRPLVTAFERTGDRFVDRVYEGLDAVITLPAADIVLPLAELYERIDFAAAAVDERAEQELLDNGGWPA